MREKPTLMRRSTTGLVLIGLLAVAVGGATADALLLDSTATAPGNGNAYGSEKGTTYGFCDGVLLELGDSCFEDYGTVTTVSAGGSVACGPDGCIGFDDGKSCVVGEDDLTGTGILTTYTCAGAGTDDVCSATSSCMEARITVPQAPDGSTLRVAVSTFLPTPQSTRAWADPIASPENTVDLWLYPPAGSAGPQVYTASTVLSFAAEIFVGGMSADNVPLPAPPAGEWTVRLAPRSVINMDIQVRAKLEAPQDHPVDAVLPNLRVGAPFELGFHIPTHTFGAAVPDAPPAPGTSCMAEEREEAFEFGLPQPLLCLRFSLGVWNEGDGPFSVLPQWATPGSEESMLQHSGTVDIPMIQQTCRFDSRDCQAIPPPAGLTAIFHKAHGHLHFQNAYVYQLWRVDEADLSVGNDRPDMDYVSTSAKLGVNPGNEAMAGWDRFDQLQSDYYGAPTNDANCIAPLSCEQRLQAGWGDFYDYNRGGNYVPFPDVGGRPVAGTYLLLGVTDPTDVIMETDDGDNTAYTLFTVSAVGGVQVLERGFGDDPWDPHKEVLTRTPG